MTLELSYKDNDSAELEVNEINNHDVDTEFEFEYKKLNSDVLSVIKKNKSAIEKVIKDLFNLFWESQKK